MCEEGERCVRRGGGVPVYKHGTPRHKTNTQARRHTLTHPVEGQVKFFRLYKNFLAVELSARPEDMKSYCSYINSQAPSPSLPPSFPLSLLPFLPPSFPLPFFLHPSLPLAPSLFSSSSHPLSFPSPPPPLSYSLPPFSSFHLYLSPILSFPLPLSLFFSLPREKQVPPPPPPFPTPLLSVALSASLLRQCSPTRRT